MNKRKPAPARCRHPKAARVTLEVWMPSEDAREAWCSRCGAMGYHEDGNRVTEWRLPSLLARKGKR
jgi:hypothetical protein